MNPPNFYSCRVFPRFTGRSLDVLVQAHTKAEALDRLADHFDPARNGRRTFMVMSATVYDKVLTCKQTDDVLELL
jgi:hypothetical protein